MRNRLGSCLKYNLKKLISTPIFWLAMILTVLYLDRQIAPVRQYLVDNGAKISWPGLLAYLLDYAGITLMAGLAALAMLFNLPMTDEAQAYIMLRAGRKTWARAQIAMIFVVTALYMLVLALAALMWIAPYVDWSGGWSGGILAFVEDGAFETYDSMLSYDPWIVRQYAPWTAAGLGLVLHFLAYSMIALLMYVGNVLLGRRAGFLIGAVPLAMDVLMMEIYSGTEYYFSPITLCRITALDYADGMGRPPVWYAFLLLGGFSLLLAHLAVRLSVKKGMRL